MITCFLRQRSKASNLVEFWLLSLAFLPTSPNPKKYVWICLDECSLFSVVVFSSEQHFLTVINVDKFVSGWFEDLWIWARRFLAFLLYVVRQDDQKNAGFEYIPTRWMQITAQLFCEKIIDAKVLLLFWETLVVLQKKEDFDFVILLGVESFLNSSITEH